MRRIDNVKLMAESGCKALFIGFESIDEETVRYTGKPQNRPSQYREVIDMLHEHGISTWGSFVFGFDTDDREVFDRTVEAAIEKRSRSGSSISTKTKSTSAVSKGASIPDFAIATTGSATSRFMRLSSASSLSRLLRPSPNMFGLRETSNKNW